MIRTIVVIFLISIIRCKHYLVEVEEDRQEEGSDYSVSQSVQPQAQGECGRSNRELQSRIIGGVNVLRNEFPWHVRLSRPGKEEIYPGF